MRNQTKCVMCSYSKEIFVSWHASPAERLMSGFTWRDTTCYLNTECLVWTETPESWLKAHENHFKDNQTVETINS